MRGRILNWRAIGAAALYALVAVTIIAAAIDAAVGYARAQPTKSVRLPSGDAGNHELLRCQSLGLAAERDAACQAAWAENRRRFLTYRRSAPKPSSSWSSILIEGHA